jgi:hypothetical protein
VKSYDFQTLLGEFGEVRTALRKVKLIHYFLNEFGELLAPMAVRAPDRVPANPADTSLLRLSARTLGDRGFIFGNNYIRNYHMPERKGVQITLRLPGETLRIPERPVDVPSGSYFIWPVNLEVGPALLKYSTAQLITRVTHADTTTYYFFAVPGIAPEFAWALTSTTSIEAPGIESSPSDGRVYLRNVTPSERTAITLRSPVGGVTRIVVLSQQQAEQLWRVEVGGADQISLATHEVVYSDGERLHVQTTNPPHVPRKAVAVKVEKLRDADPIGPVKLFNAVNWRKVEIALAPSDSAFAGAARYRLTIPVDALSSATDVIVAIDYLGDVARLYSGDVLLNDNFFNGTTWRISARRYQEAIRRGPLELHILPLRSDAPIYLGRRPALQGQRAELLGVTATMLYDDTLR